MGKRNPNEPFTDINELRQAVLLTAVPPRAENVEGSADPFLADILKNRLQLDRPDLYPPEQPYITDDEGNGVIYPGINVIFGKSGSKKTTFVNALEAVVLNQSADVPGLHCDMETINENLPEGMPDRTRTVVHIDTEQGLSGTFRTRTNVGDLLGIPDDADIPGLELFSLDSLMNEDRLKAFELLMKHYKEAGRLPLMVVIDNLQDIAPKGVNDELSAGTTMQAIRNICTRDKIALIAVCHSPKSDEESPEGWLGKLAFRYAETVTKAQRNQLESFSRVHALHKRHAPSLLDDLRIDYVNDRLTVWKEITTETPKESARQCPFDIAQSIKDYICKNQGCQVKHIIEHISSRFNIATKTAKNNWGYFKSQNQDTVEVKGRQVFIIEDLCNGV